MSARGWNRQAKANGTPGIHDTSHHQEPSSERRRPRAGTSICLNVQRDTRDALSGVLDAKVRRVHS